MTASVGEVDVDALNPAPGILVPIKDVAAIRRPGGGGCTVTLSYRVRAPGRLLVLSLSARLGATAAPGKPALQAPGPGVADWAGTVTLPLDAGATSARIVAEVTRYQEPGRPAVTPPANRRSVVLYLSRVL